MGRGSTAVNTEQHTNDATGVAERADHDELFDTLNQDLDILRVLYVLSIDMHWTWAVPTLADPTAVDQAVEQGLILAPPDPRIKVHMTDAGAHKLHHWLRKIIPVSTDERFLPLWHRVTRT